MTKINRLKGQVKWIFMALALLSIASCGRVIVYDNDGNSLMNRTGVYTLVNLHPDTKRRRLYAINYQQQSLMPLCTEVTLLKMNKRVLKFRVNSTGEVYSYLYHKAAKEPLAAHLANFFGLECRTSKVKRMSAIDQKGIQQGVALRGMTRNGVILAMGYPPRHKTPDLKANRWTYWKNRFGTTAIEFGGNGRVSNVIK